MEIGNLGDEPGLLLLYIIFHATRGCSLLAVLSCGVGHVPGG